MTTTLSDRLDTTRQALIATLAVNVKAAALDPKTGEHTGANTPARRDNAIHAFRSLLKAYEEAVKATHTSSSATYAFRDLPDDEAEDYAEAKHALRILETLYGPQEARGPISVEAARG